MGFKSVRFASYRNIEDGAVETGAVSVFLIGENGQGKTNFIDAIYTLCYGSSFRGGKDGEAARLGVDAWQVAGITGSDGPGSWLDALDERVAVSWNGGIKAIHADDKPVRDRKHLIERNPAVLFCHDDLSFANGEPERRRFFFDQTAGLVSTGYIDLLRTYRHVLKARNAALKDRRFDILDILDIQLATSGLPLLEQRARLVSDFNRTFPGRYESVSQLGRGVSVEYRPSWGLDADLDSIGRILAGARQREAAFGTTLSGPHRDRFTFTDGLGDYSLRASTGQLRLLALTLRISQAEHFAAMTGRKPILLLDDVLLELDPARRRRFMDNLPVYRQAFFTFLPGEPYGDYRSGDTIVYWTEHGRFSRS